MKKAGGTSRHVPPGKNITGRSAKAGAREKLVDERSAATAAETAAGQSGPDSFSDSLHQANQAFWAHQGVDTRESFIAYVAEEKGHILDDILKISDRHAKKFAANTRYFGWWRITIILSTGFLAILNLLSALFSAGPGAGTAAAVAAIELEWLTVIAAIFAALLATIANMENFFNFSQRANNDREARELYLNHYRNFRSQWTNHVVAFGHSPEACVNAILLHGRLVSAEKEARQSVKELASSGDAAS